MTMEEKKLTYKDAPYGFALCFNEECAKRGECMHHLMAQLAPTDRLTGPAVYPRAWQDGTCRVFCEKKLVKKAWGFTHIYRNVPRYLVAEARRRVHAYLGGGQSTYYRIHHGENMLSPKQQEDIMKILAELGSTEGLAFDHYVTVFNFD